MAATPCADPGIFVGEGGGGGGVGVQVSLSKKSSDKVLVLSLFYRSQMVNFKEIYHFSSFQRGSNTSLGGSNFFQGGSNCLFPIQTHITCDFPGGGGPDPLSPPSGSALNPHIMVKQNMFYYKL